MPDDFVQARDALFTPAARGWRPDELYRLRRQLIDELADVTDLRAAVARVDELLERHA